MLIVSILSTGEVCCQSGEGGGGGCGYLRRKGGDPRRADVCIWANYCLGGRALAHNGSSTCCSSAVTDLISVQAVCWHCCRLPGILHFSTISSCQLGTFPEVNSSHNKPSFFVLISLSPPRRLDPLLMVLCNQSADVVQAKFYNSQHLQLHPNFLGDTHICRR